MAPSLNERQAAAHLLDRFAFGARPAEVDRVLEQGVEAWLEEQLRAERPDGELEQRLKRLDTLALPATEIARTFPEPGRVLRMAARSNTMDGAMPQAREDMEGHEAQDSRLEQDSEAAPGGAAPRASGRDIAAREEVRRLYAEHGYRSQQELLRQLLAQKLWRAVYSQNQLREVLTDFWFNHFNVSTGHNQARVHVLSYERDAIRPHVLGAFRDLLVATAQHPAMLVYLDNVSSRAEAGQRTALAARSGRFATLGPRGRRPPAADANQRPMGLNENYARELMELHTLGVDGGYTQSDVIEVARALTGWTVFPPEPSEAMAERLRRAGIPEVTVRDRGGFVFNPAAHDAETKTVLGMALAAGRGIEDGLDVLELLARHPQTALFLSHKLAVRFLSDEPPPELVSRLAASFTRSGGDLATVLRTLVRSPEFFSAAARRQKIKSPFELAVSALRALDAEVLDPEETLRWIARMGQPLYGYAAPTGYPDRASAWVSTGSLLNRMSFGLQLASGRVAGVALDLARLGHGREPESPAAALRSYLELLLPERELEDTARLLEPMVGQRSLLERVEATAGGHDPLAGVPTERRRRSPAEPSPLARVVGVILGSPEFQRR